MTAYMVMNTAEDPLVAAVSKCCLLACHACVQVIFACVCVRLQVTQQAAMAHNLLPQTHPYSQLVRRVGMRIASVSDCN